MGDEDGVGAYNAAGSGVEDFVNAGDFSSKRVDESWGITAHVADKDSSSVPGFLLKSQVSNLQTTTTTYISGLDNREKRISRYRALNARYRKVDYEPMLYPGHSTSDFADY